MSEDGFNRNKTLKVSGVSKLLQDQLTKEFQRKGNSTRFHDDVNRLYVCPQGHDYVLVEFVKDLPSDPAAIGKILKIGGTELNVEKSIAPSDDPELVTQVWQTEDEEDGQSKDTKTKTDKKLFGKDARQEKFNNRRHGLHFDQKPIPFGETKVKLEKEFASKIEKDTECEKILKKENVKLQSGKIKGSWNGIFAVGQWLYTNFPSFNLTHLGYDEEEESISSSHSSIDQSEGSPSTTDQSSQSKKPDESFCVSSLFFRYIIAYHYAEYQKLEKVSKEISFEVAESKTDRNLNLFARKDVKEDTFSKTVNDFIDFYQSQNQKMLQEIIPVPLKKKDGLIAESQTKFSVVIDISQGSDKVIIYGERDNVQEAVKFLKGKCGDSVSTTSGSSNPKGVTRASSSKVATGSSLAHEKSATVEKFSCVLFQNVKVSVYQGDICKETADVIVNPANEHLKHSAGAAKAIVEAGGKSIQDESDEIMRKRYNYDLKPGEVVVTKAGNLLCNLVLHAVGPRWANYSHYHKETAKNALFSAVLNSLTVASHHGATSISIPAISSGIFGVPLSICVEILFKAATHFAKNAPSSNPLKDIRFVNIDTKTTQVFAQEMKKRFGASVSRENIEVFNFNVKGNKNIDQHAQNQFNVWQQNPMGASKGTGASVPGARTPNVTYGGSHDTHPGNKGNKSGLNPGAPAFTSTPGSYSNAVKGEPNKDKDKPDLNNSSGDTCSICLCDFTDKKTLSKCGHSFCAACIERAFKDQKKCPVCNEVYGPLIGNQPEGNIYVSHSSVTIPGYESCGGSILITYKFHSGVQGENHPNPGKRYSGTIRHGYLPDNREGQKVLKLLRKAFDQKLTFTIGRSSTSGADNVITWNDIHHKTSITGGPTNFGYPDPNYLKRVQEELAAKGITE